MKRVREIKGVLLEVALEEMDKGLFVFELLVGHVRDVVWQRQDLERRGAIDIRSTERSDAAAARDHNHVFAYRPVQLLDFFYSDQSRS